MIVFLYGTLLDPKTLATRSGDPGLPSRLVPASLAGWSRVKLSRAPWPTLRRRRGSVVAGAIVPLNARALSRLTAYEGPAYRLSPVVVDTPSGETVAYAWIAQGGTRRPI